MQQRLSLSAAAPCVARFAIAPDLRGVPTHGFPAADLALILVRQSATMEIAAIPLEPSARIIGMDPALGPPDTERLTGVDAEAVQ